MAKKRFQCELEDLLVDVHCYIEYPDFSSDFSLFVEILSVNVLDPKLSDVDILSSLCYSCVSKLETQIERELARR